MKYYINQPAGLGDILFCQKIAHLLVESNPGEIIWPVYDQYSYLSEYYINNFKFISENALESNIKVLFNNYSNELLSFDNEFGEECVYIPLTNSHINKPYGPLMEYKYTFLNMEFYNWKNYFEIKRNHDRENKLINHLNIDLNSNFNLININFGTYPNYKTYDKKLNINNSYNNLHMKFLGFDRIFDWIPIFESASEIHTVNTSIVYLIEKLNIKGKLFMYARNGNNMHEWYSPKMYRPEWKYIPYD